MYTIRTAGTWSTPAPIASAASPYQLALAPIATGGAVLSYKGADSFLYTTVLSASAPFTWSAVVQGVNGQNPSLVAPPAVATGAKGADAELMYLDAGLLPRLLGADDRWHVGHGRGERAQRGYHMALATGD